MAYLAGSQAETERLAIAYPDGVRAIRLACAAAINEDNRKQAEKQK